VLGAFSPVDRDTEDGQRLRRRFLARHPKSELYAGFGDFAFWRMEMASAHLNGGFARAADLTAADVRTDLAGAADLVAAEADAIAHMNSDHAEACRIYANKLLGETDGAWRMTGIDPDGADLALNDRTARLPFPQRVTDAGQLRQVLVALAGQARAA
jgi:putative heme iron utilization protein